MELNQTLSREEEENYLKEAVEEEDVKYLCWYYFKEIITPLQEILVRAIAFQYYPKMAVSAMTRWGKTYCVSLGIGLLLIFHPEKKIIFVGPFIQQAAILREYMADLIMKCPKLLSLTDIDTSGKERIKKETSRSRMTFKAGGEYRIFSAEGDAARLMGFGLGNEGGIIVRDEACLISAKANTKISRMRGDRPEKAIMIDLMNPWDRDNKAYDHWIDDSYWTFHVDWKMALKEGRTTQKFINEQREELTPLEFTVLYDSLFPKEAEDSLFHLAKIEIALKQDFGFDRELKEIEEQLEKEKELNETETLILRERLKEFTKIVACDPADKGRDHTVFFFGIKKGKRYQLIKEYSEAKSEPMELVGKLFRQAKEFIGHKVKGIISIDEIGLGAGPFSRLKELILEQHIKNITAKGCHFGKKAMNPLHFINKKAENYVRAQAFFNEGLIQLHKSPKLKKQLLAMKWQLTSSEKKKIIDPEDYSPDWADTLIYFLWKDELGLAFTFLTR